MRAARSAGNRSPSVGLGGVIHATPAAPSKLTSTSPIASSSVKLGRMCPNTHAVPMRGMSGERQLFARREDPHLRARLGFGGNERRLGEIHLARDRLHRIA